LGDVGTTFIFFKFSNFIFFKVFSFAAGHRQLMQQLRRAQSGGRRFAR
jgi:hypothetical protein